MRASGGYQTVQVADWPLSKSLRTVRKSMDRDGTSRMAADRERALVPERARTASHSPELYDYYFATRIWLHLPPMQDRCVAEDLTSNDIPASARERAPIGLPQRIVRRLALPRSPRTSSWTTCGRDRRYVSMSEFDGREEPGDMALDALAPPWTGINSGGALRDLPNNHREVLVLRFYDDLDVPRDLRRAWLHSRGHGRPTPPCPPALRLAVAKESADVA